jgi:hypothetical protein
VSSVLILSALVASSTGAAWLDAVIEGRGELPSLADVQWAAVAQMTIPSDDETRGWAGRARLRGLVPELQLGVGTNSALSARDNLSASPTEIDTIGEGVTAHAQAKWTLGDLVFADVELRANREALARAAAIRLVKDRVTRIYFERVEVLARQRRAPSTELAIRAAQLDGLLRAYTGGLAIAKSARGKETE